jgi:hypothetical protein
MDEKTFFDKEQPDGWDDLTRSVSRPPEKHEKIEQDVG